MRRAKTLKHDKLISPSPRYDGESVDPILAFRREMVRVRLSRGCRRSIHHAAFLSLCREKASTQSNYMNPSMSAAYQDPPFALEDNTDNRSRQTPSVTTQSLGSGSLVFSSSSLRRCKHTWGMRKPDTRDRTASSHTLSKHDTRAPKLPRYCNQPEKLNGKGEGIISCNGNDSSKDIRALLDSFLTPQTANLLAPQCVSCQFTPIETTASTPSSGSAHRRHHHHVHHCLERKD
ncbi:hypothetical protein BDP67DRAFT_178969 [Colletotrichum lupini]|nr:hypothetical protein BDP67DRAFT_178969 [Colletotrichum lupini]